jgi:hypothetical protein
MAEEDKQFKKKMASREKVIAWLEERELCFEHDAAELYGDISFKAMC